MIVMYHTTTPLHANAQPFAARLQPRFTSPGGKYCGGEVVPYRAEACLLKHNLDSSPLWWHGLTTGHCGMYG